MEAHSTAMQCQHRHEAGCTGLHGASSREFPDLTDARDERSLLLMIPVACQLACERLTVTFDRLWPYLLCV